MQTVIAFWNANRNEILMTLLIMLGIHLFTSAGGYLSRKKNMRRLDGSSTDGPAGGAS